jgi:hypothetical protein
MNNKTKNNTATVTATFGAYAKSTCTGDMVCIATTDAANAIAARKVLARFADMVSVTEFEVRPA